MARGKKMQQMWGQEAKELAIARLNGFPSTRKIFIGDFGEFSKDDIIRAIENDDEAGSLFIKMQIEYLKAVAKGEII